MKVTSGKLQVGDIKVWKDGTKQILTESDIEEDEYWIHIDGFDKEKTIERLLSEPTDVKCIKRKTRKAKERELGPDEVMRVGDVIRYVHGAQEVIIGGLAGFSQNDLDGYPKKCKVFRPITSARISRREYKRRVEAALEYLEAISAKGSVVQNTIEILKGKTK